MQNICQGLVQNAINIANAQTWNVWNICQYILAWARYYTDLVNNSPDWKGNILNINYKYRTIILEILTPINTSCFSLKSFRLSSSWCLSLNRCRAMWAFSCWSNDSQYPTKDLRFHMRSTRKEVLKQFNSSTYMQFREWIFESLVINMYKISFSKENRQCRCRWPSQTLTNVDAFASFQFVSDLLFQWLQLNHSLPFEDISYILRYSLVNAWPSVTNVFWNNYGIWINSLQ